MKEDLFKKAIQLFDEINEKDPNFIELDGKKMARELSYGIWLSSWVMRLNPNASEALRLAARCQHLKRWEIPRNEYPEGRKGYMKWRKDLGEFHANEASKILSDLGYENDLLESVRRINLKENAKENPEVQTMEDALCLVTLEYQMEEFSRKHDDDKMIGIIKKTWAKMSDQAKTEALKIKYSPRVFALIQKAISN